MQKSARILGQEYGLTGEEMNRVLVKNGFLQGVPGDYEPTEKALPYAVEKYYHRGNGGYAQYNRYWTTRTFDDSIKEELDVSSALVQEVREELAAERSARYAKLAEERAKADEEFMAKQRAKENVIEETEQDEDLSNGGIDVGKIGLVVVGAAVLGYVSYKAIPKIKNWWNKRRKKNLAMENIEQEEQNNADVS